MAKQDPDEVSARLAREAAEEAFVNAANNDPAVAAWLNADLDEGMADIIGMSPSELQRELSKNLPGISDKEIADALRDARAAQKALKGGGWLGGKPDPKLAERIMMRNGKIIELNKKKKGCAVLGLIGLGSAVLSVWGLAEIGAAICG